MNEKPNTIIISGDLLKYNSDENINEVINILNKYKEKIIAVRGNCDSRLNDNYINSTSVMAIRKYI